MKVKEMKKHVKSIKKLIHDFSSVVDYIESNNLEIYFDDDCLFLLNNHYYQAYLANYSSEDEYFSSFSEYISFTLDLLDEGLENMDFL